jgi:SNF2 family DNA or RNA helicase
LAFFRCLSLCVDHSNPACDHPSLVNGDWKQDQDAVINRLEDPNQEEDDDEKELTKALDSLNLAAASKCQLCFVEYVAFPFFFVKVITQVVPSLSNPKDTHCTSCQAIVSKDSDISEIDSAKLRKIVELVDGVEERSGGTEKIIIFSQFTSMLRLIQEVLMERGLKFVQCTWSPLVL